MGWCARQRDNKEEKMRKMRTAAIVLGAMLVVPMAGLAAPVPGLGQTSSTAPKSLKPAKSAAARTATTHSARGVVKSVDSNSLVIERGIGKKKAEMTFALDATTHRAGDINVGSTVAVRYKNDASKLMAVDVQPVKAKGTARKAAAH
jgi:hypothetical protein